MNKIKTLSLILLLIPTTSIAENQINLSAETRELLKQEMQKIQQGMESLVIHVASADWEKITSVGHDIKHSYILKQKLSKQQMHELHQALPEEFQHMDHKFHYYAGMLAHAAKEHDMEMVQFFRYRMNESCTACHGKFAVETFPGFGEHNRHEDH